MCFRDFTSAWCRNPGSQVAVGLENVKISKESSFCCSESLGVSVGV